MRRVICAVLAFILSASCQGALAEEDVCRHLEKAPVTVSQDSGVHTLEGVSDPARFHNTIYETWQYNQCTACGTSFSGRPLEDGETCREEAHTFENGKCTACGYECGHPEVLTSHETEEAYEDAGNLIFHETVIYGIDKRQCAICGSVVGEEREEEDRFRDEHAWGADGVCEYCGAVNTCAHEETYTSYRAIDVVYRELEGDNLNHLEQGEFDVLTVCEACGAILDTRRENGEYEEFHIYNEEGVCEDCGHVNTCAHVNSEKTLMDRANYVYTEIAGNDERHSVTYEATYRMFCNDCILYYGDPIVERETKKWKHGTYEDGVCEDCGHVCAHSDTEVYGQYSGEMTYADTGDDRTHLQTGAYQNITRCRYCYKELSASDPARKGEARRHWYDESGRCEYCGHVCGHSHSWDRINDDGTKREARDTGNHLFHEVAVTTVMQKRCDDCGRAMGEPWAVVSTGVAEHEYNENGTCALCGHATACRHPNAEQVITSYVEGKSKVVDSGSNRTHDEIFPVVLRMRCPDCGLAYGEPVEATITQRRIEHDYEDGKCEDCGHVNTCTHPGLEALPRRDRTCEEIPGDNLKHAIRGIVTGGWCELCQTSVKLDQAEVSATEGHSYDSDGMCVRCGHVNTCAHPNKELREQWIRYTDDVVSVDNYMHKSTGTRHCEYYCADCGASFEEEEPGVVSFERHEYDHNYDDENDNRHHASGICDVCGHVNSCAHPNARPETWIIWNTIAYEPVDIKTHSVTGILVKAMCCPDCGETFNQRELLTGSKLEGHNFNEKGVCEECGYSNSQCRHSNVNVYTMIKGVPIIRDIGNACVHSAAGLLVRAEYCTDCDSTLKQTPIGQGTEYPAHCFRNGICQECGYRSVCPHAETYDYTYTELEGAAYRDTGSDATHEVTGSAVTVTACLACGAEVGRTVAEGRTTAESHEYDASFKCRQCGHVRACQHGDKRQYYYYSDVRYTDTGDNMNHRITGDKYLCEWCNDCGSVLSKTLVGSAVVETEKHYYRDGLCVDCGHRNTCRHTGGLEDGHYFISVRKSTVIDGQIHETTGTMATCQVCPDCGARLNARFAGEQTKREAHDFRNGDFCAICGYVKSEPAPTTETTSAPTTEPTTEPTAESTTASTTKPTTKPTTEPTSAPAEKPESASAATEKSNAVGKSERKPAYRPVSGDVEFNGVKASETLPMAEALVITGKALAGKNVAIEVVGIDRVLSAGEKARFDKLPFSDRLLVALAALGFGDTTAEMSEEAARLADDISARMERMTDAERQELLNMIAELFPTRTIVIDGASCEGFSIEIRVDDGGAVSYQRYTFCQVDGEWRLYSIEVAE